MIWTENMSADWLLSKGFYQKVFGWDYEEMSEGDTKYATFLAGGRVVGGIGQLPDAPQEIAAHWSVYFAVEDTDQAVDQVIRLGGSVLRPPWDTPQGQMAVVADDQGATFAVMATPPEGY